MGVQPRRGQRGVPQRVLKEVAALPDTSRPIRDIKVLCAWDIQAPSYRAAPEERLEQELKALIAQGWEPVGFAGAELPTREPRLSRQGLCTLLVKRG